MLLFFLFASDDNELLEAKVFGFGITAWEEFRHELAMIKQEPDNEESTSSSTKYFCENF